MGKMKAVGMDEKQAAARTTLLEEAACELVETYRLRSGQQRALSALQTDLLKDAVEGLKVLTAIPTRMFGPVLRYVVQGIKPGHFLSAVITNDLREVARADDENQEALGSWVRLFHNFTPAACWGSEDRLDAWVSDGMRFRGRR